MRVISGSAKGIQLQAVPGSGTRPISDRVKGAVFNILGDAIVESRVLDLFAGTGSVGIEALSRGAETGCVRRKASKGHRHDSGQPAAHRTRSRGSRGQGRCLQIPV